MNDISGAEGYGSSSPYSGTQSTEYTGFADEQASWASATNLGVPSGIGMGGSYSSVPGKFWVTSDSRSEIGFGAIDTGTGMSSPSPFMSNLSMSGPRTHLSAFGSSRSEGLSGAQGYNSEMEQPDVDIIKDVLAMTGAIDSDDFVEGLDNEFSFKRPSPVDTLSSSVPSRAVGGGRAQSYPSSSLWSGDAFGGLISPISQSFSSGRVGADSSSGDGMFCSSFEKHIDSLCMNSQLTSCLLPWSYDLALVFFNDAPLTPGGTSTYNQWTSGFGPDQTMLSSPHRSSFVDSFFGSLDEPGMTGQSFSNTFVDISSPTSATFELRSSVTGSGGQPPGSGVQKQSLLNLLSSPSSSGVAPTMLSPSTTVFGYDMDLQPGDIVAPELAHQQQARSSPANNRLSPSERYTRLNQGGSQSYFDV